MQLLFKSKSGKKITPWQWHIFPKSCPLSIVCAEAFHFRVRDENGWCHFALTTRGLYTTKTVVSLHISGKLVKSKFPESKCATYAIILHDKLWTR